jgi:L-iditol 2-dehydrogenase
MKTLNLYGVKDIRFEDSPKPVIQKPDDVILKVKAVGICGSDISRYSKLGPYVKGMTFGHEFSGVVAEVGSGVTDFQPGTVLRHVQHMYAELVKAVKVVCLLNVKI